MIPNVSSHEINFALKDRGQKDQTPHRAFGSYQADEVIDKQEQRTRADRAQVAKGQLTLSVVCVAWLFDGH